MPATNVRSKWSGGDLFFIGVNGNTILGLDGTNERAEFPEGIDLSSGTPTSHPINMEGLTLASNMNAIRGASVNPTRTSGWISFSGTISTAPTQCYTDFRQLTTSGTAEVLGIGSFPEMLSGASCASMFAAQLIAVADSGSTIAASSGEGIGFFPLYSKATIDGATVNASAKIAAAWLSVQANVTSISGMESSIIHGEVASGAVRDLVYFGATGGALATNFLNFSTEASPVLNWGADNQPNAAAADKGLRCKVGAVEYWIPLYVNT